MLSSENPPDMEKRWKAFVDWFNTIKAMTPEPKDEWRQEVNKTFFDLMNMPNIWQKPMTLAHGLEVMRKAGMTGKDTGWVLFITVVFGAIWGNGGVLPLIETPADKTPPGELQ